MPSGQAPPGSLFPAPAPPPRGGPLGQPWSAGPPAPQARQRSGSRAGVQRLAESTRNQARLAFQQLTFSEAQLASVWSATSTACAPARWPYIAFWTKKQSAGQTPGARHSGAGRQRSSRAPCALHRLRWPVPPLPTLTHHHGQPVALWAGQTAAAAAAPHTLCTPARRWRPAGPLRTQLRR